MVISVKDDRGGWSPYGRINRYMGDGKWEIILCTKHIEVHDEANLEVQDYKGRWEKRSFYADEANASYYFMRMPTLRKLKQMAAYYNRKAWKKFHHYDHRVVGNRCWSKGMTVKQAIHQAHLRELANEAEMALAEKGFMEFIKMETPVTLTLECAQRDMVKSFVDQLIVRHHQSPEIAMKDATRWGATDFLVTHAMRGIETRYQFSELMKPLEEQGVTLETRHFKEIIEASEIKTSDKVFLTLKYQIA